MFSLLPNLLPLILTITTGFSVLIHDSQIEHAANMAVPVPFASEHISDLAIKLNEAHTHTERVTVQRSAQSLRMSDPSIQPRGGDDKKYIAQKKYSSSTSGSDRIWPNT